MTPPDMVRSLFPPFQPHLVWQHPAPAHWQALSTGGRGCLPAIGIICQKIHNNRRAIALNDIG